ncbi:hypothetical protein BDW62DRAFT_197116 [Aspergillus aurantiobrunneus]
MQIHSLSEDVDLISFLNSKTQKYDELFTKALTLLESIKSSPSCNRIAATKLVTSCQSIGRTPDTPGDSHTYLALENFRSLYAVRLAICELNGAGISIPPPCHPVNVLPPPRKGIFGRHTKNSPTTSDCDTVSKKELEPCLKSLESRPQWWTSYSNSRQNAIVICQASRSEIDKEDTLDTYNTILQSSTKLSVGLQEALRMAAEESAKSRAFVQATEVLRNQTLRDMEKSTSSLFVRLSHDLESHFGSFTEAISSALKIFHNGFLSLEKDMQNLSSEASFARHMLRYIHEESRLRSEQIALTQQQNAETQEELALALQSKLQSIVEDDITKLAQEVRALDKPVEWLYGRMVQIFEQEAGVSERLRGIDALLEDFQFRANNIDKAQQRQYEMATAQVQAQEKLQSDMQEFKGVIDQTVSTVANMLTKIDDVISTYREVPGLDKLLSFLSWAAHWAYWIGIGTGILMMLIICGSIYTLITRFFGSRPHYQIVACSHKTLV